MGAVLLLILLPLIASIGFMVGVVGGDMSASSLCGGIVFVLLAGFLFFSTFKLSRVWDEDKNA